MGSLSRSSAYSERVSAVELARVGAEAVAVDLCIGGASAVVVQHVCFVVVGALLVHLDLAQPCA